MCILSESVWPFSYLFFSLSFPRLRSKTCFLSLRPSPPLSPSPSPPLISSWTEDTRSRIFSDAALQLGTDGRRPVAAELDSQIEQRFEEFDELVASGQNILGKEHHLTQMVSRVAERRPDGCCSAPPLRWCSLLPRR